MPETDRPFFSILLPVTRDELVGFSLRTILEQDFADFEIILSHNVAPGAPALQSLPDDPRICYVRPASYLAIHDSWEFALSHARGEWILFLGDDDGFLPGMLSLLRAAPRKNPATNIFIWPWASYTYPDWQAARADTGMVSPFSGQSYTIQTQDYLDIVFAPSRVKSKSLKTFLPSIMRGAYRKTIVDQIVARTGRLFHLITPDYGAMACMLAFCSSYVLIDIPLTILGSSRRSYAAAATGDNSLKKSAYDAIGNPVFRHSPVQERISNRPVIFETIMGVREMLPDLLGHARPDTVSFLDWHRQGLEDIRSTGGNAAPGFAELEQVIAALAAEDRARCPAIVQRDTNPVPSPGRLRAVKSRAQAWIMAVLIAALPLSAPILRRIVMRKGLKI